MPCTVVADFVCLQASSAAAQEDAGPWGTQPEGDSEPENTKGDGEASGDEAEDDDDDEENEDEEEDEPEEEDEEEDEEDGGGDGGADDEVAPEVLTQPSEKGASNSNPSPPPAKRTRQGQGAAAAAKAKAANDSEVRPSQHRGPRLPPMAMCGLRTAAPPRP